MKTRIDTIIAALVLAGLAVLTPSAHAQGGAPIWTNTYNGPGNYDDKPKAIAVDGSGNVFVTGVSTGTNGYYDYATIAYSSLGVPLWTNRYDGLGGRDDYPKAIGVDDKGNIFVTGYSAVSSALNDHAYVTIKYRNTGEPSWTNFFAPEGGAARAAAIAIDDVGSVLVTGTSENVESYADYATIKYSNAGMPLWTNFYGGVANGYDYATAIAVDRNGNVFVTGYSPGFGGLDDYSTVAYSAAGVPLWTNRYGGPFNEADRPAVLVIDSAGNAIVAGFSSGPGTIIDYSIISYSPAGLPLWTNTYDGPGEGGSLDWASAAAVDACGTVFVTGASGGTTSYDYVTIGCSSAGLGLWTNRYNGPADNLDTANAIGVDRLGNVFVTGGSRGVGTADDFATIAYSGGGVPLWTNRYNGLAGYNDSATAIAVDRAGNVFVTGPSEGISSYNDYVTIKYAALQPILNIRKLDNSVVLTWENAAFCLQTAPAVGVAFTNVPGAVSPYTNSIVGTQYFFRLKACPTDETLAPTLERFPQAADEHLKANHALHRMAAPPPSLAIRESQSGRHR